jgi:hypothetical protein
MVQYDNLLHLRETHDLLWISQASSFQQSTRLQHNQVSAWRYILFFIGGLLGFIKLATIFQLCARMGCKLYLPTLRPLFFSLFVPTFTCNTPTTVAVFLLYKSNDMAFLQRLL